MTAIRILDAALDLLNRRDGADVTMAEIAAAAHVSRQAVYLHFADRTALLVAVARRIDELRGIPDEVRAIDGAPTAVDALQRMASLQARMNPGVWPVARALDAIRRTDAAAESAWQDRLRNRLDGCRRIVARVRREGRLRRDLDVDAAADLLWTLTSLRTWEDLVIERRWTARQYEAQLVRMLHACLVEPSKGPPGGRAVGARRR